MVNQNTSMPAHAIECDTCCHSRRVYVCHAKAERCDARHGHAALPTSAAMCSLKYSELGKKRAATAMGFCHKNIATCSSDTHLRCGSLSALRICDHHSVRWLRGRVIG